MVLEQPFPVYPHGFPPELIADYERRIGRGTLGNYPASGTEIIKDLGEEHVRTGKPIVYTSADSVFQVAAHEEIIPIDELYRLCEIAARCWPASTPWVASSRARLSVSQATSHARSAARTSVWNRRLIPSWTWSKRLAWT